MENEGDCPSPENELPFLLSTAGNSHLFNQIYKRYYANNNNNNKRSFTSIKSPKTKFILGVTPLLRSD